MGLTVTLTMRWDWKLHLLHVVRLLEGEGGAGLGGGRINADKAADVSSRHFLGEEISFVFIGCD